VAEHTSGIPPAAGALGATSVDSISIDVVRDESVPKLHSRATGLTGVLFLAVTGSAPLAVLMLNFPVGVGFGSEKGFPASLIYGTVLYGIFAIGYIAMARKLTATGGFYSFISHGLGRPLALAGGFSMMASYGLFAPELMGGVAAFSQAKLAEYTQFNVAWIVFALVGVLLMSVLAWFDIRVSVKVLGVALLTELALILIFTVSVFVQGGADGISAAPINPRNIFFGVAPGIGIFFALISWVGTETVVNYGEESRNPRRIVPIGTMTAMLGVGVLYTFAAWAFVSAYGSGNEAAEAIATGSTNVFGKEQTVDLGNAILLANTHFTASGFTDALSWLIISGSLACGMALNNVCIRYFYALGRESIIPSVFGRTHRKHKSPYVAVLAQAAIMSVILVLFWVFDTDPFEVYAWLGVPALTWLMGVQAVCSIAVIVYFRKYHPEGGLISTIVAPAIAFVGLGAALYLLYDNLSFLAPGGALFVDALPWIGLAVPLIGIAYALFLRARRPEVYERLGRMVNSGEIV
jgi:amino acid transporter